MDACETAPSPERNKQPILEVLARVLPPRGLVLEIGSGTGPHVAHFAKALPALTFQPSEMDVQRHAEAWVAVGNLPNVMPPPSPSMSRSAPGLYPRPMQSCAST